MKFRVASDAPSAWNLAKTAVQVVVFWSTFLLVIPFAIFEVESALGVPSFAGPWQAGLGAALFVLFSALGLWSGMTMSWLGRGTPLPFDAPRRLVTRGPYAYVANPMAVAGIGQGIAVGIVLGSPLTIAYALAGAPVWHHFVRPLEEADLRRRFGAEYDAYRAEIRCWRPRLRKWTPS